jgi:RNA polymerase sigma factor (sigma-70 family)
MTAVLPEAAAGADEALELLYRDHAQDVSRYALAVLGDRTDAEDVTQTTFLNAYRALRRGERPVKPDHWLIAIAHNVCRERFRHSQGRPREVVFVDEVSAASVGDDDGPTADDLRSALLQLPASQRTALVMRELEGRPCAEIAQALEISVGAVETLLFRARQGVREQLEEQLLCCDAVVAIVGQAEGRLPRSERASLRAHLRRCPECSRLARSRRARRPAVFGGFLPMPSWLSSLFGSGGAAGLAAKVAAVVVAGAVVGGGVAEGARHLGRKPARSHPAIAPAAVHPARRPAILPRAHAPVRVGGASRLRPVPVIAHDAVPVQAAAPAPRVVAPASRPVGAVANAPQSSTSSGQVGAPPAATDGGQVARPAVGPKTPAGGNGKNAASVPGNAAKAKTPPPGQTKKNQPQPAAAAPAAPAPSNGQGNGQGNGQPNGVGNGQPNGVGNGQANGQPNGEANGQGSGPPPATPAAAPPAQSNAGANGHK